MAAAPVAGAVPGHARVRFDYHAGFLMNLHHALLDASRHPARAEALLARSTPDDANALRAALDFYRASYADSDILFGDDMAAIKRALAVPDDGRRDPHGLGLASGLEEALARAAPAYARLAWENDSRLDRAWIDNARTLDARYGATVQAAVERGLNAGFPAGPVRVDLVADTGTRQGAYTDVQVVMPSNRADYQGLGALEMLYHEAAHVASSDRLERDIAVRARARGRDADSQLWHVLHFYTVGKAASDAYAADGIAYVQYAARRGLYADAFAAYAPMVDGDWARWLAGRETWQAAIDGMVEGLPPAKRAGE